MKRKKQLIEGKWMLVDQPEMEKPRPKFNPNGEPNIYGSCICVYCGYRSSSALHDMKHLCVMDDYNDHIKSLQRYIIDGNADFLPEYPVENKDYIIEEQEKQIQYTNGDWSREIEIIEVARVITQPDEFKTAIYKVIEDDAPYHLGQLIYVQGKKDQEYFNNRPGTFKLVTQPEKKEDKKLTKMEIFANDYAKRVCNGQFPIEYTREQVVRHTKDDVIVGANEYKKYVLSVLKENYEACKTLTDEDKIRSAQDIVNETYEDLISIFSGSNFDQFYSPKNTKIL